MSRLWAQSGAVASGRASNLATSFVFFCRSATLRTVSNSYLVNLALSDILLSTLACPITLGNSMAKICSYVVLWKGDLFLLHYFINSASSAAPQILMDYAAWDRTAKTKYRNFATAWPKEGDLFRLHYFINNASSAAPQIPLCRTMLG